MHPRCKEECMMTKGSLGSEGDRLCHYIHVVKGCDFVVQNTSMYIQATYM